MKTHAHILLTSLSALSFACGDTSPDLLTSQQSALSESCLTEVTPECAYRGSELRSPRARIATSMTVPAAHREVEVPVTVYVPPDLSEAASLPVVVWTHGGGFIARHRTSAQGRYWATHLAQAGYVVVLVSHLIPSAGEIDAFCALHGVAPEGPECEVIQYEMASYMKPADTKAVIDGLDLIEARLNEIAPFEIDLLSSQLAVGGWSGGSGSSLRLAGASYELTGLGAFTQRDERPVAFIAVSPSGDDRVGFTAESFSEIERPVLTITAEGDVKVDVPVEPRVRPHYRMPATGDKYQMYLNSDATFHGSMNLSPDDTVMHNKVQATTAVAFLDAKVRGVARAQRYLDSHIIGAILDADPTLRAAPPTALDLAGDPVPLWNIR